jgi:hypothetical protein
LMPMSTARFAISPSCCLGNDHHAMVVTILSW